MSAHHNYHCAGTFGIRYGLQGFIPRYRHEIMELTPDSVREIHEFGGTILASSRGPQPPEEVVDALERMNISILFMIGGDGTMKAAQAVTGEVLRRGLKIAVVGIPKTIDNDINFVTRSFGFDTAVEKATEAIRCAHIEALGHGEVPRVLPTLDRETMSSGPIVVAGRLRGRRIVRREAAVELSVSG